MNYKKYQKARERIEREYDELVIKYQSNNKSLKTYDLNKNKKKFAIALEGFSKNQLILDVGVGTGNFIKHLKKKKLINYKNYYGIDFSNNMCNFCKQKYPLSNFFQGDLLETNKKSKFYFKSNKKFDLIICFSAIQHKPRNIDTKKYIYDNISKFYKFLNKDGKIVFDIFYDEFVDYKDQNLSYLNQNQILKICQNFTSKIRIDLTVSPYEAIVTLYK